MTEKLNMEEEVLKGKTLLVVDDEVDLRDIVSSELEFMGAHVFQAENVAAAQKILATHKIDLIVSDIRMPGGTGIDLLDGVKRHNVNVPPVILITGFADITTEDAFNKGAEALLNKPFKLDDLIRMVVRYTSPYSNRFSEEGGAKKRIEPSLTDGDLKVGRGGIAVKLDTNGKKFEIGEVVSFDFVYDDQTYKGEGVCRWFRPTDQGARQATMGLEFVNLTHETLDHFKAIHEDQKTISYIPSLDPKI